MQARPIVRKAIAKEWGNALLGVAEARAKKEFAKGILDALETLEPGESG